MPDAIQTNNDLVPKMVRYIELSSALGKRACDQVNAHEQAKKQAADFIPGVVDSMIESGAIAKGQKQAACEKLATHRGALELLKNASARIKDLGTQKTAGDRMGSGVADSVASTYNSLTDPYVGVKTTQKKASDAALIKGLGLSDRLG